MLSGCPPSRGAALIRGFLEGAAWKEREEKGGTGGSPSEGQEATSRVGLAEGRFSSSFQDFALSGKYGA